MVIMIPYSLDELVAMGQFLAYTRRAGLPFWRTFWQGGVMEGGKRATSSEFDRPPAAMAKEMFSGGVNYPWTLMLCVAIGVWLMFTRLVFGTGGSMADSDHLVGALVVTFTFAALAEVARPVRFINIPFGAWLVIAPWMLSGADTTATIGSVVAGVLLMAFSLPRGPVRNRYGAWDFYVV